MIKKTKILIPEMIIVWIIAIDMIILLGLFVKLFLFPLTTSFVATTTFTPITPTNQNIMTLGPETEYFLQQLKNSSSTPMAVAKIKRHPFTVYGTLVTLNGDNIQVFEYPEHDTAMTEASLLTQEYISSSRSIAWKNNMHVYVNDKLVVFYMGNKDFIMNPLRQNAGLSMMQFAKVVPVISKVGI
jgi:hypothetical protein